MSPRLTIIGLAAALSGGFAAGSLAFASGSAPGTYEVSASSEPDDDLIGSCTTWTVVPNVPEPSDEGSGVGLRPYERTCYVDDDTRQEHRNFPTTAPDELLVDADGCTYWEPTGVGPVVNESGDEVVPHERTCYVDDDTRHEHRSFPVGEEPVADGAETTEGAG